MVCAFFPGACRPVRGAGGTGGAVLRGLQLHWDCTVDQGRPGPGHRRGSSRWEGARKRIGELEGENYQRRPAAGIKAKWGGGITPTWLRFSSDWKHPDKKKANMVEKCRDSLPLGKWMPCNRRVKYQKVWVTIWAKNESGLSRWIRENPSFRWQKQTHICIYILSRHFKWLGGSAAVECPSLQNKLRIKRSMSHQTETRFLFTDKRKLKRNPE